MRNLLQDDCLLWFLFCFLFRFTEFKSSCWAVVYSFIHSFSHSFLCIYSHSFIHSFFAYIASTFSTLPGKMSLLLIALLQLSLLFRNVISTCSTTSDVEFTFYGCPDGPSDTTSFGCSGSTQVADGTAGGKSWPIFSPILRKPSNSTPFFQGDGSYANPETFATALNNPNFTPCEIIYIPLFQKYFQYMDHCQECMTLYPTTTRIDLWIGSDVNGGQNQIDCEDAFGLKTGQMIVRDPPSSLKVNGGQLWDNDSGTCGDGTLVFPGYGTDEAGMCAGGSGGSPAGGGPVPSSASSSSTPPASTPSSTTAPSPNTGASSTPSDKTTSGKEKVDTFPKVNTVAKVAEPKAEAPPAPTTLATIVSTSTSSVPSPSGSASEDCGVTSEWPTAWLGHCVGTPCHEFNDCSGELICQGWPNPVCTNPSVGK